MQKKIYVVGMDDEATASKVDAAVKAVAGVNSVTASFEKCQVMVDCDDSAEQAVNAAIESAGVTVLG
ncbi:MAG: cation transporter [Treponemataceae bacterium]|nr:cation transporter [Treponemataceae bacterium]